jgi:hypothetical protein
MCSRESHRDRYVIRASSSPLLFRLTDLDEVAVRIAHVAPRPGLVNLRFGEELCTQTLPTLEAFCNVCETDVHEAADSLAILRRREVDSRLVVGWPAADIEQPQIGLVYASLHNDAMAARYLALSDPKEPKTEEIVHQVALMAAKDRNDAAPQLPMPTRCGRCGRQTRNSSPLTTAPVWRRSRSVWPDA